MNWSKSIGDCQFHVIKFARINNYFVFGAVEYVKKERLKMIDTVYIVIPYLVGGILVIVANLIFAYVYFRVFPEEIA
jgi:hypothetical protein